MLQTPLYQIGKTVMTAYAHALFDLDVALDAPLPAGPKIFAPNHPTTIDPFVLPTVTTEQMHILVTESCFKLPLFGRYLRAAGHVPVVHTNGRAAFDEALQLLKSGQTLGLFPEGALSPLDGGLRAGALARPHTGLARLALLTGAPVIPVGIYLQPEHIHFYEVHIDHDTEVARWYFHGPYAITIGESLRFDGDAEDRAYVRSVTDRIAQRISRLTQRSAMRVERPITVTATANSMGHSAA